MIGNRILRRCLRATGLALLLLGVPGLAGAADLASARLLIAGTRLTVSPESQTVPYDTPTIVETHLEGYDAGQGTLPSDLRVLADFTGPEVDGVMVLETLPNQPFRIPRLRLQGEYRLDNIRLVQGSELLAYAAPRSSSVLVTQVLITRVTSRALTLDEIRSYGIVVDDSSFQAFNFTFAFAVAGETVNYNVPVVYFGPGKDQQAVLWDGPNFQASPWRSSSAHFQPPRMAPFQLQLAAKEGDNSSGGCQSEDGDCSEEDVVPIPGVILFPTDISLLHQFFSVVLMAQNGAPAGDRLTIRDLTARVTLPPGLRQAKTDPPTPLGVPVPVRVPGPDGKLGTGDDLTFLIAQATGQAEVQVEGLSEGTHVVQFDLDGILEGLPGGQIRRLTGQARGAVIVRDPTLNVTITHPDVVRADEEYTMLLTVSNTGNAPANQLKVRLPAGKLSGVQVVGASEKTVDVAPGESEILDFRLKPLRTGRVTATAARASASLAAVFDLTVGVGENGIPLSPNAIILPISTDALPQDLVRNGLNLIGLGFSLATAPPSLLANLPRVSRPAVDSRVYQIAQAGRHVALGEELFDSAAQLAAEWTGARDQDWEWDLLRRTTQKGAKVGVSLGAIFAAEAALHSPQEAFDRFASSTGYLPVMEGALATGSGVSLEVSSLTGGQRLAGVGNDSARVRALPFADLYDLGGAQMALLAVPEAGGYKARLRASSGGTAGLRLLVPGADGALRMVRWSGVSLSAGGTATADFRAVDSSFSLAVDTQGDGTVDDQVPGTVEVLQARAFRALAAVQNIEVDPTGHVVDVLFSTDVDPRSLVPGDPRKFTIPGKVSNGGSVQAEQDVTDGAGNAVHNPFSGLRDTRIVRVVFNNPLSPYATQNLTVSGMKSALGEPASPVTMAVEISPKAMTGILVHGRVYGPDGQPVPFAEVELRESDLCLFCAESCRTHKTAVVRADSTGSFLFDYVRQTSCSDVYQLKATDGASGHSGTATGRVRFVGQQAELDVVMLGRGTIRGRVRYDDGTVPAAARVIAESPVFREGRGVKLDAAGNFSVTDVPVGTITLSATDGQGRFAVTTVEIPAAGSVIQHDLVIVRQPDQPVAHGDVRGVIYRPDGETPVAGAYVALYVDGNLVGVKHSGADGTFDFGTVPAGHGEIETFESVTGQSGVQVFFDLKPDQVNQVNLVMRDQRGVVQGYVYRRTGSTTVPVFGAVVWAEGTPFQTVTNPQGFYRLEGVFAGTRNISAAEPQKQTKISEAVTIGSDGQVVDRNLYFQDVTVSGIAGEVLGLDGSPVAGATVHLAAGDQYWFRTATTDGTGRFLISGLGLGSYGVHGFKGALGATAGTTVRFAGDTPFVTLRFKRGSIHGVVKVNNGGAQPVGTRAVITYRTTTVRLELVGLDLQSHTLETAADGSFDIPDVLAGPYVITATNAFYGGKTVRGEVAGGGAEPVEIVFDGTSTGTIRGVVLAPDGVTPVPGASVKLRHPSFSAYDATTGADGAFTFELVPPVGNSFPVEVTANEGLVFRQAQAWVQLNKPGQALDLEIVLPRQGAVSGQVQDSNGQPVPGAVVTLQEGSYPRRNLTVNADGGGNFAYQNVFAGIVTLSAKAPSLGGLGGKTTVEITAEGQQVEGVVISLEPTGKVAGRVTSPVDGSAVASAEVRLLRGGRVFDTVTADGDGRFEFSLLPLAIYDVRAFDPRTGRFGRRAGLTVTANGQVVAGDVQLEARGSVIGHLYEAGTTAGVPGGTIQLYAYSIEGFTTYSSTDAGGAFEFRGIPQGQFDLSGREPVGRRRAFARGEIVSEGQQLLLDLYLDRQATLVGSVLNPVGAPDGVFPNANTVLYQDSQIIGATLDSRYSFSGVILGRYYYLYAQEVGGPHKGDATGRLDRDGEVRVDVRMHPIGSVVVNVLDSFGHPVPGAQVTVYDEGYYGDYSHTSTFRGDTGTDNSVTFQTVGEGKLSIYALDPATGLRGSVGGWLTQEGQIVELNVRLQNSALITGRAVLPDGATPAAHALVAVQAGALTLTTVTDETGAFTVPSIPLGSFLLILEENAGPANREVRGNLTANGQVLDLGTLTLDATDPQLVSIAPAAGAVDVPRNAKVVVRFSEPMDAIRNSAANIVRIETAAGQLVGGSAVWKDGDTAIEVTPYQLLPNASIFRIKVNRNLVFDKAGRQLAQSAQTTFTTADQVPPSVIEVVPANAAKQVAVTSPVRVTFSEVVAPATLSGAALRLTDVTTGLDVSTTYLLDAANRSVTITPAAALLEEHVYRLTVQGVADPVGNAMPAPFTSTFAAYDGTPPRIAAIQPAAGTSFNAGDAVAIHVEASDPSGLQGISAQLGGRTATGAASPFDATLRAPFVSAAGDVDIQVRVTDTLGNAATAARSIHVLPRPDTSAPAVSVACPRDGDAVAPGIAIQLPFHLTDDQGLESWAFLVDGQTVSSATLNAETDLQPSVTWTPPAAATAGTTFTLRIETHDFAGNLGFREVHLAVPSGVLLTGNQTLTAARNGQALSLAAGTFTVADPLSLPSLKLLAGAKLVTSGNLPLAVTVSGALSVQCGATVGGESLGYAGGGGGHPNGYAPVGVPEASGSYAAGSHGGKGVSPGTGRIYDSVYEPRQAGGGGASGSFGGAAGGGVVRLQAAELSLEGQIVALGQRGCTGGAGAGGSVRIEAGVVRGAGSVDASGGPIMPFSECSWSPRPAGGGRVALLAGAFDGFDPAAQVKVWGGSGNAVYAAPGTLYYKLPANPYGILVVDSGKTAAGVNRVGAATELPTLGNGTLAGLAPAGADAWASVAGGFKPEWRGAWMKLLSASGADLGSFRVADLDAQGRALLAGAGAVTGAVSYRGEYRFDRIDLLGGASLQAADPIVGPELTLEGDVQLPAQLQAANVRIKAGARVHPSAGGTLDLDVAGKLTVEAGAVLDVSGLGYAGGAGTHPNGYGPDGVTPASGYSGPASHGGRGVIVSVSGTTGDVYDSVYEPRLAGAGGATGSFGGYAGGGILRIKAGEVQVDGQILAQGLKGCTGGSGAGGTILVDAGTVSGAGTIDASGGDEMPSACSWNSDPAGGGRVALTVGAFSGFDPATQARAWGGADRFNPSYAAPGSVYYRLPTSIYGVLVINNGKTAAGANRAGRPAELPVLGGGALAGLEPAGSDAWASVTGGFKPEWRGAWMQLLDGAGAGLGSFRVADLDGQGRALLAGAGAVTGAARYQGEYRFDRVDVLNGVQLQVTDPLAGTDLPLQGDFQIAVPVRAANLTLAAGSVLRPAPGTDLALDIPGTLTIAAGARLDVSGLGYAGGTPSHADGFAPAGVRGATGYAGAGSHGGAGNSSNSGISGEVYDSVYNPSLGGGGGSRGSFGSFPGGGVARVQAGELALDGQILARGLDGCVGGSGAGGSVLLRAGTLRGAGSIDASGGNEGAPGGCSWTAGSGGGGRVAIYAGTITGFDPAAQARAYGGRRGNGNYAAAGTLFTKLDAQAYGALRIDQGNPGTGTVDWTLLTPIGRGVVGAVAADTANPSALWITPQDPNQLFGWGVAGMWARIDGVDYKVLAQSADRRQILLAGASPAVTAGRAFVGYYKLDALTVTGKGRLESLDGVEVAGSPAQGGTSLNLHDVYPPALDVTQPAAGAVYQTGQPVQITAQASDPAGVTSVTFQIGDRSFTDTAAPYTWTVPAPVVQAEGDVPIAVQAVDTNGNAVTVVRTIHVQPLSSGSAPAVALTCPTPGALLAPGTGIDLAVAATSAAGVERVELLTGSTALATDFDAPYTFRYTAPAGSHDGDVIALKVRARGFDGQTSEVTYSVRIVEGTVVTADRTVSDASLDGTSVVVAGGTLTLSGTRSFRDLVVLDGAKVTHAETTAAQESKIDLTLQRDLYVACGGAIDVTGRGYLGSSSSGQRAYGFGNSQAEGASAGIGGSHGGRGGAFNGSSPVYGNLVKPFDSGAGGGAVGSSKGRDGGGVVKIVTVSGNATLDGQVLANGEAGSSGAGGAGGSVWIAAANIRGAGSIQAAGSPGGGGTAGGGSGGRIALYAGSVDAGLLGRTLAAGANTSSADLKTWGAAGTIFVKPDLQMRGDLILDNGGNASAQITELLPVGSGIVDAVSATGFTDNEADFRFSLEAADVVFNGDSAHPYEVKGNSHHGTSLTLGVDSPPLSAAIHAGDTYQGLYRFNRVVVRNGALGLALDPVSSVVTPEVGTGSTWNGGYAPTVQLTSPAAGATYTAGATFVISADAQSTLGVRDVELRVGSQSNLLTAAPYTWTASAPTVSQAADVQVSATMTDLSGNRFASVRTIHVQPFVDPNAPVVTLTGCPASGDQVAPGVAVSIPFAATDNDAVASYSLVVNGVTQQTVNVNQATVSATLTWTPPANAAAGTTYTVRVEARDFAGGMGYSAISLVVPSATLLTGNQNLTTARNGQSLILGPGVYTVQAPLSLSSLTLLNGAQVVGLSTQTLGLTVSGALRVQCGGLIDVTALGYAGATTYTTAAGTAPGMTGSKYDAGGSHGGSGALGVYTGPVGDVFDSVYQPQYGGGGGSLYNTGTGRHGGNGGGVVTLTAGELVLGGEIRARGEVRADPVTTTEASGAGGTVVITAGTLSGTGKIDASGGSFRQGSAGAQGGSGGGGRVALYVDTLSGFDPAAQVKVWGGALLSPSSTLVRYAGPGTLFVKKGGDVYGRLTVDGGKETDGTLRTGPLTALPPLGTGTVSSFQASGSDAWVATSTGFKAWWAGAWMVLQNASGASLGSFQVASVDAQGKALLKGAAAVTGAAQYFGQYRFDEVDLKGGAGLSSNDELQAGTVVAEPGTRLPATFSATSMTVKAGAPVILGSSGNLSVTVSGRLTVESGAVLDLTGLGYLGSTNYPNLAGTAPGVTGSKYDAGGSHGGLGTVGVHPGPAGDIFDSVYQPQYGGGGGTIYNTGTGRHGGNGGGVVTLNAGELVLEGEIRSRGEVRGDLLTTSEASGAGGTVMITAGTLSGAGTIDASGGWFRQGSAGIQGGSGGGGRVALYVGAFSGFDPAAQVKAWGGKLMTSSSGLVRYAGPGTVLVKKSGDLYGRLIVDNGKETDGTDRTNASSPLTALPSLGTGTVSSFQASGADAWVGTSAGFKTWWTGAWMVLTNASGASLGSFQVLAVDAQNRALLKNAGSAVGAAQYRGQYRFDELDLKSSAGLTSGDELVIGTVIAEPGARLPASLSATDMTVKAGAPVTLGPSGSLSVTVSGRLTVESGAVLDATGLGYLGSTNYPNLAGSAPGVTGSKYDAGGSHGGLGVVGVHPGPAGDVFDSVYQPQQGGGGGTIYNTGSGRHGGNGGGVVTLNAGELVLEGEIRSRGEVRGDLLTTSEASGAGGTVMITAGTLSGAGKIDASGGWFRQGSAGIQGGSGGGGRVALYVDTFSGFDPAAQVKVWGGALLSPSSTLLRYAGPGTLLVKKSGDVYGRLTVDSGKETDGTLRTGPVTALPPLGTGTLSSLQASGTDAWASTSAGFKPAWVGAWMVLTNASGASLGSFQVLSVDTVTNKALLKGAASVTGAAQYRGQYRFDALTLKSGAGLSSGDELQAGTVVAEPGTRLPATFSATSMTVKAGTPVILGPSGSLSVSVSGRLTVESGAVLDATGLGYLGSTNYPNLAGSASGVTGSKYDAGGSHGGFGALGVYSGPVGEIFDSVYQPQYGGGGGTIYNTGSGLHGGNGGGVVTLNAGELVLEGEIRSRGEVRADPSTTTEASGAGGTVLVTVGTLSGAGKIDVSGGSFRQGGTGSQGGSGGGGRVALYVDTLSGFDPATQVKVTGGALWSSSSSVVRYASPGTVFVKLPAQTYGKLYVDQGGIVAGKPIAYTTLPSIGSSTVQTATADTLDPTALWISPPTATPNFSQGVIGMWVKVNNAYYRVIGQSADRRQLLLAGAAGAVQVNDTYRGVYRFDEVIVRGGARLQFLDDREVTTFTIDSTSSVTPSVP